MRHSLRLRLLIAMIVIPVVALVAVGVTMSYTSQSTLSDSFNFTVVPVSRSRGQGPRSARIEDAEIEVVAPENLQTANGSGQVIRYEQDTGQAYLIEAEPGFVVAYREDQRQAVDAVNRRLAVAVAVVAAFTAVVAWWLSRRILRPVETLTAAARRMEAGDLGQRVAATSRDELGALGRAFNAMAESIERNNALRKTTASDIAHELRTPLNNIAGYLEAIEDGVVQPEAPVIASLQEEAALLLRLVQDLELISLVDAGHLRLFREQVDLAVVVERVVGLVGARAAARGVTVSVDVATGLPGIDADAARLGQVIRNLLENAITHTPEGGAVSVAVAPARDAVMVTVSDTGPGIPPEHLPFVFERFYRADPSRSRSTGGAGLGLAIVRQIVEAHGGSVAVESPPGSGARFTVRLPVRPPAPDGREALLSQASS